MPPFATLLHDLGLNGSLIISLVFFLGFLPRRWVLKPRSIHLVAIGLLFGIFAFVAMQYPINLWPGVTVDSRTIIVPIAAYFFGPIAGGVALVIPVVYRLILGGVGAPAGVGIMITAAVLGLILHYRWGPKPGGLMWLKLAGLGMATGLLACLWVWVLPSDIASKLFTQLIVPIPLIDTLMGLFIGMVVHQSQVRKARDQELHDLNANLEAVIVQRTAAVQEINRQLMESEKLASLGRITAGIAHELNTPLGSALVLTTWLQDKIGQHPVASDRLLVEIQEGLALIEPNLRRAGDLIQNFKFVAADRLHDQARLVNPQEYLANIWESIRPKYRQPVVEFDCSAASAKPLWLLPGTFSQVVSSLIANAFDHGFKGKSSGAIRINLTFDHPETPENRFTFRMENDGWPIPTEFLAHLGEPFFSGAGLGQGHTGQGLFLIRDILQQKAHLGHFSIGNLADERGVFVEFSASFDAENSGA